MGRTTQRLLPGRTTTTRRRRWRDSLFHIWGRRVDTLFAPMSFLFGGIGYGGGTVNRNPIRKNDAANLLVFAMMSFSSLSLGVQNNELSNYFTKWIKQSNCSRIRGANQSLSSPCYHRPIDHNVDKKGEQAAHGSGADASSAIVSEREDRSLTECSLFAPESTFVRHYYFLLPSFLQLQVDVSDRVLLLRTMGGGWERNR